MDVLLHVRLAPSYAEPGTCRSTSLRKKLFCSQRFDGIDLTGAAGGEIAGEECNDGECDDGADQRDGVERTDVVKQTAQRATCSECAQQTSQQSQADQRNAFPENEPQHIGTARAERKTDSHFARALRC